jgi:hypothetical protein
VDFADPCGTGDALLSSSNNEIRRRELAGAPLKLTVASTPNDASFTSTAFGYLTSVIVMDCAATLGITNPIISNDAKKKATLLELRTVES